MVPNLSLILLHLFFIALLVGPSFSSLVNLASRGHSQENLVLLIGSRGVQTQSAVLDGLHAFIRSVPQDVVVARDHPS